MVSYSKDSLQTLRDKIDLVELISSHIQLKKQGAHYKACCPFHDEKTPSFVVQRGDKHYHCFGCGAHGDAIAFLMEYLGLSFVEAIESLADRFNVPLEKVENKAAVTSEPIQQLKEAMNLASRFFHFYLLHSEEGRAALQYLYKRGIDLDFIRQFSIGFVPSDEKIFFTYIHSEKISNEILHKCGLLKTISPKRAFFHKRVSIPIHDTFGNVVGFSCRKIDEKLLGPKYINTPETPLFKKSKILFGLRDCRRTIAKQHNVILVEGQIDALRLIQEGYHYTLSAGGTAFGSEHIKELSYLGVQKAFIAFDGDEAGQNAAAKTGHLLQKAGIEVYVVQMDKGEDPDSILIHKGPNAWQQYLDKSIEYLQFLVAFYRQKININTPAGKNEIVKIISEQIKEWDHPLMIHEGLKKVAEICQVPYSLLGDQKNLGRSLYKRSLKFDKLSIDPNRILEIHLLKAFISSSHSKSDAFQLITKYITEEEFQDEDCKELFIRIKQKLEQENGIDLIQFAIQLDNANLHEIFNLVMKEKYKEEKASDAAKQIIQKILERNWMNQRETIRQKIQSGKFSEEEVLKLAKQFDQLKAKPPNLDEI